MQKTNTLRLIPALIAVVFSGTASAAGFQLFESSVSSLGNAYAGSAAVAENATTLFFNPAGMTQLQDREFSLGATYVEPSFKFTNNASAGSTWTGNGGDGGSSGVIPNAHISWALNKDIYLGLSIGAPFGLMTDYDRPWIGAAQSEKFSVKTLNVNPSIAWRASDVVSLGFGLDWQQITAEYVSQATSANIPVAVGGAGPGGPLVTATMKFDGDAWGWNAGALFKLGADTKIGVSYRSVVKYDATGDIQLASSDSTSALGVGTASSLAAKGLASNIKTTVKLPDTFILSGTHKFNDRFEGLADVSWTGWSSIQQIDIYRTSGVQNGALAKSLLTKFRDTWRVALGANYQLNDAWKLRAGVAYEQTPVKGADTRLVSLPDNDRTWLSLGAQWKLSKATAVDVGAAYLLVKDAPINNNQTPGAGLVNGTFKDSAFLFGAQFSMAF